MILSFQKNFPAYTFEEILDEMTFENLLLYQRATPLYDDEKDTWDESKDANNPENFKDGDEFITRR